MRNKYLVFVVLAVFTVLFWEQIPGFNYLIFCLVSIGVGYLCNPQNFKKTSTWLFVLVWLLASCSTAWYADPFSIFLSIVCMLLAPAFLIMDDPRILTVPYRLLINFFRSFVRLPLPLKFRGSKHLIRVENVVLVGLLPLVILGLFLFLYSSINPDFKEFLSNINLSWLNFGFIGIILWGYAYGVYFLLAKNEMDIIPQSLHIDTQEAFSEKTKNAKPINKIWVLSAATLFIILCLALGGLLIFDFNSLFIHDFLHAPDHSNRVHRGVEAVIISIVLAIVLILIYLGGKLNFSPLRKWALIPVYGWILLNGLLVVTTTIKNTQYIAAYGLTYKRIGVYIFLTLCLLGLIFVFIKLVKTKTNAYVFRTMAWTFMLTAGLICPVNWSSLIAKHNIMKWENKEITLELYHLSSLNIYAYKPLKRLNLKLQNKSKRTMGDLNFELKEKKVKEILEERMDWQSKAWFYHSLNMEEQKNTSKKNN